MRLEEDAPARAVLLDLDGVLYVGDGCSATAPGYVESDIGGALAAAVARLRDRADRHHHSIADLPSRLF